MLTRSSSLAVVLAGAMFLVAGCGPVSDQPANDDPNTDEPSILTDDLDLDSYYAEGVIDGLTWQADLCALNLIPAWPVYHEGVPDPSYRMQFESYDNTIQGGVVIGQWQLGDGGDHPVQINKGTFSVATDAGAQEPGTISVELEVTEYPPGGDAFQRTVTGAFNLTPVIESPGCTVTDTPEYLREALKTYAGPAGG